MRASALFNIRVATLHMQPPSVPAGSTGRRKPVAAHARHEALIMQEGRLRRKAYRNTLIQTDDAFFDDSDMSSDYYLLVVYDKRSGTALLSARYYFSDADITRRLKGHLPVAENRGEKGLFFIDRMSANQHALRYRQHRAHIHLLFYSELAARTKGCCFVAMARKEKAEKLLKKYLRLGMQVSGDMVHQGKAHWILTGDMDKSHAELSRSLWSNLLLILNYQLSRPRKATLLHP